MDASAMPPGLLMSAGLSDIAPFSGEDDLSAYDWLKHMSCLASLYRWDSAACLCIACAKLRGTAAMWLDSAQPSTWKAFQTAFMERFGEDAEALYSRFEQCSQRRGEPTRAYRDRFLALAARAGRLDDPYLPTRFFKGLTRSLRRNMVAYKPMLRTIDDMVTSATSVEDWTGPTAAGNDEDCVPAANTSAHRLIKPSKAQTDNHDTHEA
jgi:hypothetical protein